MCFAKTRTIRFLHATFAFQLTAGDVAVRLKSHRPATGTARIHGPAGQNITGLTEPVDPVLCITVVLPDVILIARPRSEARQDFG